MARFKRQKSEQKIIQYKMKNLLIALIAVLSFASQGYAQDAEKDMKKAGKLLGSYHLNPEKNESKLADAKGLIDRAFMSDAVSGDSKAWNTRGEIYNAIASKESLSTIKNPNAEVSDAALVAYESFSEALDAALKKYERKDALKGLAEASGHLNSIGYTQFQRGKYEAAYKQFEAVIKINDLLEENDMKGVLGDDIKDVCYRELDVYYAATLGLIK